MGDDRRHPPVQLLPQDGTAIYFGPIFEAEVANRYFQALLSTIPWQQDEVTIFGRRIITQRETAWYGDRPFAYTYSHSTKVALPWTPELQAIKQAAEHITGKPLNSCLLNLYQDGKVGMGWHSDDEPSIVRDSGIASVSFGATRRFDFRHRANGTKCHCWLESGSLLLMDNETQRFWQHSLPKATKILDPRINLTFRLMRDPM